MNLTKLVDSSGQTGRNFKSVVYYNKSKSNNRGEEGCLYLPDSSWYEKGMSFLTIFKVFGVMIGIPIGLVLACLCLCCICNCGGVTYYLLKKPRRFDSYHISTEINLYKLNNPEADSTTQEIQEQPQNM